MWTTRSRPTFKNAAVSVAEAVASVVTLGKWSCVISSASNSGSTLAKCRTRARRRNSKSASSSLPHDGRRTDDDANLLPQRVDWDVAKVPAGSFVSPSK